MQRRATLSKKLETTTSMQNPAPDTKWHLQVQSLRHAKTLQHISSILMFPFSVHPVQPEWYQQSEPEKAGDKQVSVADVWTQTGSHLR